MLPENRLRALLLLRDIKREVQHGQEDILAVLQNVKALVPALLFEGQMNDVDHIFTTYWRLHVRFGFTSYLIDKTIAALDESNQQEKLDRVFKPKIV